MKKYRRKVVQPRHLRLGLENLESRLAMSGGSIVALAGNWDASVGSTLGLYDRTAGQFYLRNDNSSGFPDFAFSFGAANASAVPIAGDWDGNGSDTVGLYYPATGTFTLRNANSAGPSDVSLAFGLITPGALPFAGDFNGDGRDTVGLYDPATGQFAIKNTLQSGPADRVFLFGLGTPGLAPIAGDWNGDGIDTVGLYSGATGQFLLTNNLSPAAVDKVFSFGPAGDATTPLVGDWIGLGRDSLGYYDTSSGVTSLKDSLGPLASGPAAVSPVIDDGDAGYSTTGAWQSYGFGFGAGYQQSRPTEALSYAMWTFAGLTPGQYQVYANYLPFPNRATDAPYAVSSGGATLANANINQQVAPDDLVVAGTGWKLLGGTLTITAGDLTVSLSNLANGNVIADAVGLVRVAGLPSPTPVQPELLGEADTTFYVVPTAKIEPIDAPAIPSFSSVLTAGSVNAMPLQLLSQPDVDCLLMRAAAASASQDAIIAIVDRGGHILGVRVEAGVPIAAADTATLVFAIDGAVAKARTAAFFANDQAPLTSRTIRFISQSTVTQREVESNPNIMDPNSTVRGPGFIAPIGTGGHFPPAIAHTPPVDLFAIEHTNRDSIIHPGLDSIKGTPDDIPLTSRFNVPTAFIPAGQEIDAPESYGFVSGRMPNAQSRGIATLPGGIPLFKNGVLVGGIGVFFPGPNGYATFEQGFVPGVNQTELQRTNAPKVLEAEWIAFAAAGGTLGVPVEALSGIPRCPDFRLPAGRIDLVGITLDLYGPNGVVLGPRTLVQTGARVGLGNPNSGTNQPIDAALNTLADGQAVPDGWLVLPHGSGTLSTADVQAIIDRGIAEANAVRAQIRLPLNSRTRMVLSVADKDGNVLALYRMPDATFFSIDVAVAKARNTAYYNDPAELQTVDQVDDNSNGVPDLAKGVAFTNRTFRFLAEPRYPSGVEGSKPGAFSILRDVGINSRNAENIGAPVPAASFSTVLGFDAFNPGRNFRDPVNIANQNGVVFFPGSSGVYQTSVLVGGFGVSGDGVDQDDVVTYFGQTGFAPPQPLRADMFFIRGVRLPYQKFPRNPLA